MEPFWLFAGCLQEVDPEGCVEAHLTDIFYLDSTVVLWISQNMEDEYSYNLQL